MNNHISIRAIRGVRGSVMVMIAPMMLTFIALTALTIDLSRILLIRNELQNAADAAALRGANYLYPLASTGGPNWSLAQTKATEALAYNKANNAAITNAALQVGFWDLTGATSTLKSTGSTQGINDVPGIQVTISKSSGNNGGPVTLFFGSIIGIPSVNVSAKAIGIAGSPNSVAANTLFPVAMSSTLYSTYWDFTLEQPKIDPSTGKPYIFHINEGTQGGWSSFGTQTNDTPSIINLILNGNPSPISTGDQLWMSSGVKASAYTNVPTNTDVIVAIVSNSTAGLQTVTAFGALHIDFGVGGSGKYVQVHFTTGQKLPATTINGQYYGVSTPGRLVK